MNSDHEFETRSKQRSLQRWDDHLRTGHTLEGAPVPVQRRLLGAVDEDNDDNASLPPPRLPRRRLLYHDSKDQEAESSQSSAKPPDDSASNRAAATDTATASKPTKTAGDDETVRGGPIGSSLAPTMLMNYRSFEGIQNELYSYLDRWVSVERVWF
ncbi:hypothetical protein VI817_004732 [Penicillium citrinum]|nr:hypothetical protein VI817_004732 [Penicillium citrinum]